MSEQVFHFMVYWLVGCILVYIRLYVLKSKDKETKDLKNEALSLMERASQISPALPLIALVFSGLFSIPASIIDVLKWAIKSYKNIY